MRKAAWLAWIGKHEAAVRVLEPEIKRYQGSFRYYYLLGVSCLYAGDFGGALIWFRLAREIKMRDPLVLLGLAAMYLRRGETDKAVDYYLEVQELDPKNELAKKALGVIRKYAGPERFADWLESGSLPSLYPRIPFPGFSLRMILVSAGILAAALLVTYGALVKTRVLPNPLYPRGSRGNAAEFSLSQKDRIAPVESGDSYRYQMTREAVVDAYDKALSLFTEYRDEAAKINLNRILESNAAEALKNSARILRDKLEVPDFGTFKRGDNVSYSDVIRDPQLYRGVYVIWRGKATNVVAEQTATTFDFILGDDSLSKVEGIVPGVTFDRAVLVNTERPLEVLGQIVPDSSGQTPEVLGRSAPFKLLGLSIHQSGKLEQ